MSRRRAREEIKYELFYLVFWECEDSVSIYPLSKIISPDKELHAVGDVCMVKFKNGDFEGKIASYGSKADMIQKEKDYLVGKYTPFAMESNVDDQDKHSENKDELLKEQCSQISSGSPVKQAVKKRKRKLVNVKNDDTKRTKQTESNEETKPKEDSRSQVKQIEKGKENKKPNKKDQKGKGKKENFQKDKKPKGKIISNGSGADSCTDGESSNKGIHYDDNYHPNSTWRDYPVYEEDHYVQHDYEMDNKNHNKSKLFYLENRIRLLEKILPTALANTSSPYEIAHFGAMNHFTPSCNMSPPGPYYLPPYPHMENGVYSQGCGFRNSSPQDCEVLSNARIDASDARIYVSDTDTSLQDNLQSQVSTIATITENNFPQGVITETPPQIDRQDSSTTTSPSGATTTVEDSVATIINNIKPPIPKINKAQLLKPDKVVAMHPKLVQLSCIPRLSVKLAKESFFGTEVIAACTVRGLGNFHALPIVQLKELKGFLQSLCVPRLLTCQVEFEQIWKNCVESIGQACKTARAKKS